MTKDELIAKLTDLEWEDFEVKEAKGEVPKSAWQTVSAFSNTAGGWLVFGVKQRGSSFEVVKMTNPEKIEQDFLATLRGGQKFNTVINPTCAKHTLDGATILAFYIPVSPNKPVYFNTQSNTYIRRGSADQKATQAEIDAMYRDQTFGTKSSELAIGTSYSDLKEKSIREYRDYMSRFNTGVSYNRMELDEFLVKMRVLDKETKQCTFAGLLFFGQREVVEHFFADFRIDLLEIPGTSYTDAISRYTFRISEDDYENLWEAYFECMKRLRKEVDVEFKLNAEGFGEELSPGLMAVREALVNMLMHADYFAPACPRVRIFNYHIEYYNPGGLPKPLEELKGNDLSIPRNPILAKLFRMVKLAENAGYGFDKIEDNWRAYNNSTPEYIIDFDSVIVQLFLENKLADTDNVYKENLKIQDFDAVIQKLTNNFDENLVLFNKNFTAFVNALQHNHNLSSERLRRDFGEGSERLRRRFGDKPAFLLFLIALDNTISAQSAAQYLGVSQRMVENYLQQLREQEILDRIGGDFGGQWLIKISKQLESNDLTSESTDLDASKKQTQPTFSPDIWEKLSTDFDENTAFFSENFTAFVNALKHNHNLSSETVRRQFGDGSERVRRQACSFALFNSA